jgi:hypothetical protein
LSAAGEAAAEAVEATASKAVVEEGAAVFGEEKS